MPPDRYPSMHTWDNFCSSVPWGENRAVLVYRRTYGAREYIRLRTWNRHRTLGCWYPSPRFFVIPIQNADALANAIWEAAEGIPGPYPEWLAAWELEQAQQEEERWRQLYKATGPPPPDHE